MRKITKKSKAFFIAQCLYCTNIIIGKISWKNSIHFMTQKYQKFRCRVIRTVPKYPTLPYFISLIQRYTKKIWNFRDLSNWIDIMKCSALWTRPYKWKLYQSHNERKKQTVRKKFFFYYFIKLLCCYVVIIFLLPVSVLILLFHHLPIKTEQRWCLYYFWGL
jgi:hypothetical protein